MYTYIRIEHKFCNLYEVLSSIIQRCWFCWYRHFHFSLAYVTCSLIWDGR